MKENISVKILNMSQMDKVSTILFEKGYYAQPHFGPLPCHMEFCKTKDAFIFRQNKSEHLESVSWGRFMRNSEEFLGKGNSEMDSLRKSFNELSETYHEKLKELHFAQKRIIELGRDKNILVKNLNGESPAHYDNSKGSLYKVATERGWNPYLFDIVKRLERGGKKDPIEQEIDKTIYVLKLWKEELKG